MVIPEAAGDLGQGVAFVPARVMRVAAGDLHDVDAQLVQQSLELGHTLDLKAPATDAEAEGRESVLGFDVRFGHGFRHLRDPVVIEITGPQQSVTDIAISSEIMVVRRDRLRVPVRLPLFLGFARGRRSRRPIRSCV